MRPKVRVERRKQACEATLCERQLSNALLGGTATKWLPMTALFVSGLKRPGAQAASNDHCNPGTPHWYVDTRDMHRPLIQGPHSVKNGDHTEENT